MFAQYQQNMRAKSAALILSVEGSFDRIVQAWLLLAGTAALARILLAPHDLHPAGLATFLSYMLLIVAPAASALLAREWFRDAELQPQPSFRLARIGRWRTLSLGQAKMHPLYGAGGILVSLMVGLLVAVALRAVEYLAAMPPLPGAAPPWLRALHVAMTTDVVLFGALYMIAFVAALRRAPFFPRLLAAIWVADLLMQVGTAKLVSAAGPLPPSVAEALTGLLHGNLQKVLISMAIWLPYLLLSKRVNVTYRRRIAARESPAATRG